jgi:hypothetical protein
MSFQIPQGTLRENLAPLEMYLQSRGVRVHLPVTLSVDEMVLTINNALEYSNNNVSIKEVAGQKDEDLERSLNRILVELG